ncbi:MAG: hypothetical protein HN929_07500 [Chloroflexi bacterium]|jgi:hypothetical protein|nr:hypothetical protein [Chloroflexota bacterium]MBT7081294.1 hypothetical protein [Chloroflexota bacterium]MBT7289671.1 hypothetical protein [Chloroflexota bacterium]
MTSILVVFITFTMFAGAFTGSGNDTRIIPTYWDGQSYPPQGIALNSVWGSSSTDVFAVGLYGSVIHYDGCVWTVMDDGTDEDLYGVWGSSAYNVFAVGNRGTILHYDGSTWTPMRGLPQRFYGDQVQFPPIHSQ